MGLLRIDQLFHFQKGALQSSKCVPGLYNFITASSDWKTHNEYTHDCEALIFAAAASGSLGRTHYVNGKFLSSDLCFIITPKDPINTPINLQFYQLIFNELQSDIVKNTKAGTSKEAIGLTSFGRYRLPYFNIKEQEVIKNKILDLKKISTILNIELIHQLSLGKNIRQQFLQDAVQGKLVNQNQNDEPAAELLRKIKAEKAQLIKDGKLKKEKELPKLSHDEMPFDIPKNWIWCRLGEILLEIKYGTSQSCNYDINQNTAVLRIPNVSNGVIDIDDLKYTNLSTKEKADLSLKENDLLIIRSNGSRDIVGKTALVDKRFVDYAFAGYLIRLRFNDQLIDPQYLLFITQSGYFRKLIESPLRTTVGINNINTTEISNLAISLPPIADQHRIVQKLNQLIQTCDALEASIKQSQQQNEQILQQVLREALTKKAKQEEQLIEPANVELKSDNKHKALLLAAEIIWQLNQKQTLGHIKLQKLIYLCNRTQKMNLPVNFLKWAMGPYDPELQKYIDTTLVENEWFKYDEDLSLKYQPLKRAGGHKEDFDKYFASDKNAINHLIQLFENAKSARIEIVATLFACWDELIAKKQLVNDNSLLAEFYNWSEKKKKHITEKVIDGLRWMETQGIVPN